MTQPGLIQKARSALKALSRDTGETVGLAAIDLAQRQGRVLCSSQPAEGGIPVATGLEFSIPDTAPGKAFLAAIPERRLTGVLAELGLFAPDAAGKQELMEELKAARRQGYAFACVESHPGTRCVGSPILLKGKPTASIWLSGPAETMGDDRQRRLGEKLARTARKIARRLSAKKSFVPDLRAIGIVEQAKAYMEDHPLGPLDMKSVVAMLGVEYFWFHHAFTRLTGVTPNRYHLNLRVARAAKLLEQTNLPIEKISDLLGYRGADYFSVIFKKKMGLPPLRYRTTRRAARATPDTPPGADGGG